MDALSARMLRASVAADGLSVDVGPAGCPRCGDEWSSGFRFCRSCGTKREDAAVAAEALGRFRCVLVREGRGDRPVAVIAGGSAPSGGGDPMEVRLPPASAELNGGEGRFALGRDVYVTYAPGPAGPAPEKCPLGLGTFCGAGGKACADLVGWLCLEDGEETYACAALCSANGGAEAARRPSAPGTGMTKDDVLDLLAGTEGGAG